MERVTYKQKAGEYKHVAEEITAELRRCAKYGFVPLSHDADVFDTKIAQIARKQVAR